MIQNVMKNRQVACPICTVYLLLLQRKLCHNIQYMYTYCIDSIIPEILVIVQLLYKLSKLLSEDPYCYSLLRKYKLVHMLKVHWSGITSLVLTLPYWCSILTSG